MYSPTVTTYPEGVVRYVDPEEVDVHKVFIQPCLNGVAIAKETLYSLHHSPDLMEVVLALATPPCCHTHLSPEEHTTTLPCSLSCLLNIRIAL